MLVGDGAAFLGSTRLLQPKVASGLQGCGGESGPCGHGSEEAGGDMKQTLEACLGGSGRFPSPAQEFLLGDSQVEQQGSAQAGWPWDWAPGHQGTASRVVGGGVSCGDGGTSQSLGFVGFCCPWRHEVAQSECQGGSLQAGSRPQAASCKSVQLSLE